MARRNRGSGGRQGLMLLASTGTADPPRRVKAKRSPVKEPARATAQTLAILKYLLDARSREEWMYGYRLHKALPDLPRSTVYHALDVLSRDGRLEQRTVPADEAARHSIEYRLSARGVSFAAGELARSTPETLRKMRRLLG